MLIVHDYRQFVYPQENFVNKLRTCKLTSCSFTFTLSLAQTFAMLSHLSLNLSLLHTHIQPYS
jgi:hypothetical protein